MFYLILKTHSFCITQSEEKYLRIRYSSLFTQEKGAEEGKVIRET